MDNLPAHRHEFSGKTDSFDYGSKRTDNAGNHVHEIPGGGRTGGGDTLLTSPDTGLSRYMKESGNHYFLFLISKFH